VKNIFCIPTLAEKADLHYTIMQNIKATEAPPAELKEFFAKHDESLTSLTQHIEKEKEKVTVAISESQKLFITITNQFKETIAKELDAQVDILNANFKFYKSQYSGFYRGSDQVKCQEFPSFAEIMNQLNNSSDKNELETKLKELFNDLTMGTLSGTLEEQVSKMKDKILTISQSLKEQTCLKPSTSNFMQSLKSQINELSKNFERSKDKLFSNKLSLIANNDPAPNFDSVLLDTDSKKNLFQKWLPSKFKTKLLYRGSRDGYTRDIFHEKCDNFQHTITVFETSHGKMIGGYSDQIWNHTGDFKTGKKCFLFSISDKEMYPLKNDKKAKAISTGTACGPIFGDGQDLLLYSEFNKNGNSFSKIGSTYDAKGTTRVKFTGGETFSVKEIEIFFVEFV
jgi:hypothetical protein